jgi:hypothetical protein
MSHSINFLHRVEPEPVRRRAGRARAVRMAAVGLCGIFVAWMAVLLFAAGQVVSAAFDGKDALLRARDAAVRLDFEAAALELDEAGDRFASAERGFFLLGSARVIPFVSDQISAARAVLSSGRDMIDALGTVVDLGAELVRLTGLSNEDIARMREGLDPAIAFDDLSSDTKRAILDRLAAAAPDFALLAAQTAMVRADLAAVESSGVAGPLAGALGPIDARLAEAEEAARTVAVAAELLPELAGLGGARTHLLLFMNNTELRPGGGFIGTFGVLTAKDGDIVTLETRDSYAFDHLAEPRAGELAPPPLQRYNAAATWFFRDANWSPDFAESAVGASRLFGLEMDALSDAERAELSVASPPFDGVIGLTPTFLSSLLRVTGPIVVGSQTFDADNVTDKLEYQVEIGYVGQGIPEAQRKEVIADLVNAVKSRVFSTPLSEWGGLIAALERGLVEKQVALMSLNANAQDVLENAGWGGRVEPGTGDAQMLVDANMASLKSDPAVSRAIRYEIFRNTSGQYVARTSVRYAHTGTFDWKTTRYRTYARLYVPAGSELIRVDGAKEGEPVDVADDLGMTSFGAFVSVEPGEQRTLIYEFTLADSVVEQIRNGSYRLRYLKQVGAQNNELTLHLDFDKNVTAVSVPEDRAEWGDDVYILNTKLDRDLGISVEL